MHLYASADEVSRRAEAAYMKKALNLCLLTDCNLLVCLDG